MTEVWSDLGGPIDAAGADHERIRRAARAIDYAMQDARRLRVRVEALPNLDPAMRDTPLDAIDTLLTNSLANISNQWASAKPYLSDGVVMAVKFWARDLPDDELDISESELGALGAEIEELLTQVAASTDLDAEARDRLHLVIRSLRDVIFAARTGGQYAFSSAIALWEGVVRNAYAQGVPDREKPMLERAIGKARAIADDIGRVKTAADLAITAATAAAAVGTLLLSVSASS